MPSVKGMQHMEYLGHFSQDKWLAKGHNDVEDRKNDFFARMGRVGTQAAEETADEKFRRQQRIADEEAKQRQEESK